MLRPRPPGSARSSSGTDQYGQCDGGAADEAAEVRRPFDVGGQGSGTIAQCVPGLDRPAVLVDASQPDAQRAGEGSLDLPGVRARMAGCVPAPGGTGGF